MALVLQRLGAYGVAVLATEALAAMASTQFVLAGLTSLGVVITLGERLTMTGQDILGMMQVYLPVLALALALGFLVAGVIIKKLGPAWSLFGYSSAGFVAVLAAVLTVLSLFDITPIAGARSPAGLFCQGLAGAVGGIIFHRLKPSPGA